jgi:hypothetical protein
LVGVAAIFAGGTDRGVSVCDEEGTSCGAAAAWFVTEDVPCSLPCRSVPKSRSFDISMFCFCYYWWWMSRVPHDLDCNMYYCSSSFIHHIYSSVYGTTGFVRLPHLINTYLAFYHDQLLLTKRDSGGVPETGYP